MAVFGNLSDFALTDVFRIVKRRKGRLQVHLQEEKTYDLFIEQNLLTAVLVDGRSYQDIMQLRSVMLHLLNARKGVFLFAKTTQQTFERHFEIELDQFILAALSQSHDMLRDQDRLPHEMAEFVLISKAGSWVDPEVQKFLDRCEAALASGTSSHSLARRTGLDVDYVRLNLFKLEAAGMVRPARRSFADQRTQRPLPGNRPKPPTLSTRPPVTPGLAPRAAGSQPQAQTVTHRFGGILSSLKKSLLRKTQNLRDRHG
jgi:hypothetical protein